MSRTLLPELYKFVIIIIISLVPPLGFYFVVMHVSFLCGVFQSAVHSVAFVHALTFYLLLKSKLTHYFVGYSDDIVG